MLWITVVESGDYVVVVDVVVVDDDGDDGDDVESCLLYVFAKSRHPAW